MHGVKGSVVSSAAHTPAGWTGKLRHHPVDPYHFQFDNGDPYVSFTPHLLLVYIYVRIYQR